MKAQGAQQIAPNKAMASNAGAGQFLDRFAMSGFVIN